MVSFTSDYINGAHPQVLQHLLETNSENLAGYCHDKYVDLATAKIREACACPEAEVVFFTGGTQTNATVICSTLRDFEGVVAAKSGHVFTHEAGAVEYTGHKVLTLPAQDGKLSAATLQKYVSDYLADGNREHMVYPGMVYISQPTEYGTLYSLGELTALSKICHAYHLPLYIDGARLAYALMSKQNNVTLPDLARLADMFYIGGTKCGALCGEAVVFTQKKKPLHFENFVKKRGALVAKGRVLSVQFDALFTNDLYYEIGKQGIAMAEQLKAIFQEKGYRLLLDSPCNQQFVILDNATYAKLSEKVEFRFWEKYDEDHSVARFTTSWSTTQADLDYLRSVL